MDNNTSAIDNFDQSQDQRERDLCTFKQNSSNEDKNQQSHQFEVGKLPKN